MEAQTYANHRHRPRLWLIAALSAVIGFVLIAVATAQQPSGIRVGLVLTALTVVSVVWMVRQYALRLQDRIIRLEMQTRVARLSMSQIVALRFAPDAELPALMARAIAENLTADQIKRAVTTWEADYLRT